MAKTTPEEKRQAKNPDTNSKILKDLSERNAVLSRIVAQNPKAPPELLKTLGQCGDKTTRKWAALHPGTPSSVLVELATEFPAEVLENPIFDFLILENPNFFEEIQPASLRSLIKREQLPAALIKHASKIEDEAVQLALLQNSNLPQDIVAEFGEKAITPHVAEMAKRHVNSPELVSVTFSEAEELFWGELEKRFYSEPKIYGHLLGRATVPKHKIRRIVYTLAGRVDRVGNNVRRAMAISPETDPVVLACLAAMPSKVLRQTVFANPGCPDEIKRHAKKLIASNNNWAKCSNMFISKIDKALKEWASSDLALYHYMVANYKQTPESIMHILAKNSSVSSDLLVNVAKSSTVSGELLHIILTTKPACGEDRSESSRSEEIASHPNLLASDIKELSKNSDYYVRVQIAIRSDTPLIVLKELASDEEDWVRRNVAENICKQAKNKKIADHEREFIVKIIDALMNVGNTKGYFSPDAFIAANPLTPVHLLEKISKGRNADDAHDADVLGCAAYNLNTPKSLRSNIFKMLVNSSSVYVRSTIADETTCKAMHPELEAGYRNIEQLPTDGVITTPVDVIRKLANDQAAEVRQSVAENLLTPENILVKLAKDDAYEVRLAVMSNTNTPEDIRLKLAGDMRLPVDIKLNGEKKKVAYSRAVEKLSEPFRSDLLAVVESEYKNPYEIENNITEYFENNSNVIQNELSILKDSKLLVFDQVLASHPETPVEILDELVKKYDYRFWSSHLAKNPNISYETLIEFSNSDEWLLVCAVLENPRIPVEYLERHASDENAHIRSAIGGNTRTPVNVLTKLSKDSEVRVREEVAKNPATPADVLYQMALEEDAHDPEWCFIRGHEVFVAIAENPNLNAKMRVLLVGIMGDDAIKRFYRKNMLSPDKENKAVLKEMSCSGNAVIRKMVAQNQLTPISALKKLTEDIDDEVRVYLVSNKSLPPAFVLTQLSRIEKDMDLYKDVHKLSIEKGLINLVQNGSSTSAILRKAYMYVRSKPGMLMESLSTYRQYSYEKLHYQDVSNKKEFYYSISVHPNTPRDILEEICAKKIDGHSVNQILTGNAEYSKNAWGRILDGLV